MNCAVCGAPVSTTRTHCAVCGFAVKKGEEKIWDRAVESSAYQDLSELLKPEENLLAVTRGKITGGIRRRFSLNPQALLSPYANVGLTGERIILQFVNPNTGEAVNSPAVDVPATEVSSLTVTDADPIESERTMRMVVTHTAGSTVRVRVAGRLAKGAKEMAAVWRSLSPANGTCKHAALICRHCLKHLDTQYKFCPYCGKDPGAE